MASKIDNYTPKIPAAHWDAIGPFVREAVREGEPSTPYHAGVLMAVVTAHVRWAWMRGEPLERRSMFDRYLIEEFTQIGCPATWSPGSRGNGRSVLFRIAEALLGPDARTPRLAALPPAEPISPYSQVEVASLRSWADTQSTATRRRDAMALLALGAGAGLATEDILPLRVGDVRDRDGALVVHVQGRRERNVPVLAGWCDDLQRVLVDDPEAFVFRPGRTGVGKNSVTNFVSSTGGLNKPSSQRLRATWIVHHLTAGTPMKAFMAAAGVQSLEALTPLPEVRARPRPC
ncbi:MAG: hypothetical protein R2694_11520 [Ilumatobacteraceae bacterium]